MEQTDEMIDRETLMRRYLGRVSLLSRRRVIENDGRSWICLIFFCNFLALVHSYCFFLHISDKHRAFRTVLCEKISKNEEKKSEATIVNMFLLS